MTDTRTVAPWLKSALELGPALLFFAVFLLMRERVVNLWGIDYQGFIIATIVFVPVQVAATLVLWRLSGRLSAMQVMTLVLVVVFGGLTAWLNDPRFFEMKPTILYLFFAAVLGLGLALRKNWLSFVFSDAFPMTPEGWRILTIRLTLLFVAMAGANEFVRHMMSQTAWVYFKTFGILLIMFAFFILNARLFERYAIRPKDGPENGRDA